MSNNITSIKNKSGDLSWINIVNASKKEINYLDRKYKFEDIDLKDSYAKEYSQRPKFYDRGNYCFLVLQFPIYRKKDRVLGAEEVDFFVSKNFLATVHRSELPPLVKLFNACYSDNFYREQYMSDGNAYLLYEIVLGLQEYVYPILDHISLDIKNIEKNIFAEREKQMITEILRIKRNIFNARTILEAHKNVIQTIAKEKSALMPLAKWKPQYSNLIDHTKNIWEILEGQKDLIESLEKTNATLVSYKLNNIMKTLTIFSVIVFPLTLLAAIFGMNTVQGMPFMNTDYGFWIIIGIMGAGVIGMFMLFKNKKWI